MLNPFYRQQNSIPDETDIAWPILGYSSMGIDVTGSFSSGSFSLQGTNDGQTWTTIETKKDGDPVTGGVISVTGHYVFNILGFNTVRLLPSSLSATLELSALATIQVAGEFAGGGSDIFPDLAEGLLWNPGDGDPIEAVPPGNVGQLLTSRGPGLIPEMRNAADINAFTTGSALVSNPVLTNSAAKFGRVTAQSGVLSFITSTGAGTTNMKASAFGAGLWVAVGDGGVIMTSPTGLTGTWTSRVSDTGNNLNAIAWTGTVFIAVGGSGTVTRSSDGITWVAHNIGASETLHSVAYSGTRYAVGAINAHIYWSTTGTISSWTVVSLPAGAQHVCSAMVWSASASLFLTGSSAASGLIASSPDGSVWTTRQGSITGGIYGLAVSGVNLVAVGGGGVIYSSTNATSWTSRTSGTASALYTVVAANGYFYALGASGASIVSTDNGVTWGAGLSVGSSTIRGSGVSNIAALVVGDTGAMYSGGFPFRSTVYPTNADRLALTNALGSADYIYSDTPIPVIITGQLTFNIAVVTPSDMPFNFDVVTIADMVYNLFVVQNSSLSPGPYYCFNAVYDFGVDNRWEFGAQSVNQYATLLIQDSTTGAFYIKKSSASGNAGAAITWVDSFMIDAAGGLTLASLVGTGTRTVVASAAGKLSAP